MLPNKTKCYKKLFCVSAFFGRFLTKKQPKKKKIGKTKKFSEIWYVDASQQKKMLQKKLFLDFGLFWPFFNQKNSQKTAKKIICQNPNRLIKFSEISECRCFPTKKCYKKTFFGFRPFLAVF